MLFPRRRRLEVDGICLICRCENFMSEYREGVYRNRMYRW